MQFRTDPTPASGSAVATETVYDILGRPVATRYVGESAWTCTSYDARGRVVSVTVPPSTAEPSGRTVATTYRFNGDPYVTRVTDAAGNLTTTVDSLGRTVRTVDVWGVTTASVYDQAGRLVSATTTIAGTSYTSTSVYAYDTVGRLTEQKLDGLVIAVPSYSPDTDSLDPGKLVGVAYPAGTGNGGNDTYGSLAYDTLGRLSSLTWRQSGSDTLITSDAVTRSLSGSVLTTTTDGAGSPAWSYTYDAVGRLARATGSGRDYQYGFAASGGCGANAAAGANSNRTSLMDGSTTVATYCYDSADRLTSTTQSGYTGTVAYDSHGNTVQLAGESHSYDAANRHVGITKAATVSIVYQRDATGRMVSRTQTLSGGSPVTYRYGYSGPGDSSSLTMNVSNGVLERVVSLPGGVLFSKRSGSNSLWSYPNVHGDVVATANQSGVKQAGPMLRDPFGAVLSGGYPDNLNGAMDYGWLGQHQRPTEHVAGLVPTVQMGARVYNPTLGRFLQVDPAEGGSCHNFDYLCADPVNGTDLDGRRCWRPSCIARSVARTANSIRQAGGLMARGTKTAATKAVNRVADTRVGQCARQFRCAAAVGTTAWLGVSVTSAACVSAAMSGGATSPLCIVVGSGSALAVNTVMNKALGTAPLDGGVCAAAAGGNPITSGFARAIWTAASKMLKLWGCG